MKKTQEITKGERMGGSRHWKKVKGCQWAATMGLLLLLLLLFLLSPLSCSASHLDQKKSYGSSVVAPVQELHQLIIGEVKTIKPISLIWELCTPSYVSSLSGLLFLCSWREAQSINWTILSFIIARFYPAVGRSTSRGGWSITELALPGQHTEHIYRNIRHHIWYLIFLPNLSFQIPTLIWGKRTTVVFAGRR